MSKKSKLWEWFVGTKPDDCEPPGQVHQLLVAAMARGDIKPGEIGAHLDRAHLGTIYDDNVSLKTEGTSNAS
jgi:hypothetical protein